MAHSPPGNVSHAASASFLDVKYSQVVLTSKPGGKGGKSGGDGEVGGGGGGLGSGGGP